MAGAQIQNGHTLLGLEADIDWAHINGSSTGTVSFNGFPIGTATLSSTLSSVSTARARVGYALDNWLFFVTGGLAVTNET
jgi:outer membrane immunogenic protein